MLTDIPAVSRAVRTQSSNRSFATVADPPVRRYGGLKDQDRIFTNAYCRHDHGLKGAQVCTASISQYSTIPYFIYSLEVTGTAQKTSY